MSTLEWLKARWRWVLVSLALALTFVLGLMVRRAPAPLPPAPGPSPKQKDEDAKANDEERKADVVHDQTVVDAQKDHDAGEVKEVDDLKKKTATVEDDLNAVNQTLLDVGKQVRDAQEK